MTAPEEEAWCAVRRVELRVRTVGCCDGVVKDIVVLAKMRAFDAVDRVWLPITSAGVSLLRIWVPI